MIAPSGTIEAPKEFKLTAQQNSAIEMFASDATDCGLGGGSRSGKTFLICYAIAMRALRVGGSRHAILRFRQNAVKKSVVGDTWPKVLDLIQPGLWNEKWMNRGEGVYKFPNGSEVWFGGLDDKDRVEAILGNEYATVYFNECSQIPYSSVITALTRLAQNCKGLVQKAYYDFNPPSKRHWTYKFFIDKISPETGRPLLSPNLVGFMFMNPVDNQENLTRAYIQRLDEMPDKARRRFFLGLFADEDSDALFTDEQFDSTRCLGGERDPLPDMVRITVNVDPMGMADDDEDKKSDEVGITVTGLGVDGRGYLLEDLSGHYGPSTWGRITCDAYQRWKADCVVAESNFGGGMVKFTIEASVEGGENIKVKMVQASRGKVLRAEPISALYEKSKIRHYGHYPELEEQACDFYPDGYKGPRSPDRFDSAVFGFTELFPGITKNETENRHVPAPVIRNSNNASCYGHRGTPGLPRRH